MPIETRCPACGRGVRVPDDLLGKRVKCPTCQETFTAEEGAGQLASSAPPLVSEPRHDDGPEDYGRYDDDRRERRRAGGDMEAARAVVSAPAICLIVLAVINILGGAYCVVNGIIVVTMFDELMKAFEGEFQKQQGAQPGAMKPEQMRTLMRWTGYGYITVGVLSLIFAIFILVGAIKMKGLTSAGWAKASAILAMIPAISFCFPLGIAFGIWSLVVMSKPEVRHAFDSVSRDG